MSTFPLFKKLPIELRLKIWEAALPRPRIISINLSISKSRLTTTPPPNLLSICSESRGVVFQHYHPAFTNAAHPSGVYIDPALDTILLLPPCPPTCYPLPNCFECFHFDYHSRLSRYDGSSVREVENVAVHDFGLEGLGGVWKYFPGMKRLSVVVDHHWAVGSQRRHPMERMVEVLLGKAREDVSELVGTGEVEVRVVSAEEMRFGRGVERVGPS